MRLFLAMALVLALIPGFLQSAEPDKAPPKSEERLQADMLAELGKQSLAQWQADNQNPQPLLTAAQSFAEAQDLYTKAEDVEAVCDMQANLFWVRKQLNQPEVQTKLAAANEAAKATAKAAVDAAAKAEKQVVAGGAKEYLDRAKAFAKDHADDQLSIAIRFAEVAERFLGTAESIEAQRLSLDAQTKAASTAPKAPPKPVAKGEWPIPDAAAQKAALAQLKKLWAKDYAKRKDVDKAALARTLLATAGESADADQATLYMMWSEAARLAGDSETWDVLLLASSELTSHFKNLNQEGVITPNLPKTSRDPVVKGIRMFLTDPASPEANLIIGRHLCLIADRWNLGLPMLAAGSDRPLAALAGKELANPSDLKELTAIGDQWYDFGRATKAKPESLGMLRRALATYLKTSGKLTGVSKETVGARIAELTNELPVDPQTVDFKTLTQAQWERIPGSVIAVDANADRVALNLELKVGQRVRVIPAPGDQWTFKGSEIGADIVCGWQGADRRIPVRRAAPFNNPAFAFAALVVWVGDGAKLMPGVLTGPGTVYGVANKLRQPQSMTGAIRVKLVPMPSVD